MDAPYSPATLEGLTNAELRTIAARAGAITARRASKTPYPSRVPPSLILQFLPLDSVARALRVSATWRGQAEPTFRGIAERSGHARQAGGTWRDAVRDRVAGLYWEEILDWDPDNGDNFFDSMKDHPEWPRGAVNNARGEGDCFVVGKGVALDVDAEDVIEFDVQIRRLFQRNFKIVDAVGMALLDDTARDVRDVYLWNSDGGRCGVGPAGRTKEFWYNNRFGRDVILRIAVARQSIGITLKLSKRGRGPDAWTRLDSSDVIFGRRRPLVLAPIVRLFQGSSAKLLRAARREPAPLPIFDSDSDSDSDW
jgi:hypothetical protein